MKKALSYALIGAACFYLSGCALFKKRGTSCNDCSAKETFGHTQQYFENLVNLYTERRWAPVDVLLNGNEVVPVSRRPVTQIVPSETITGFTVKAIEPTASLERNAREIMDARSAWFSLDSLKQFICTIEKYNSRLRNKADTLGIRMYYAVYPDDHPRYPGKHTLIMVPTREGVDYDPRDKYVRQVQDTAGKNSRKPFMGISIGKGQKLYNFAKNQNVNLLPMLILAPTETALPIWSNDASLCPPCSRACRHGIGAVE